MKLEIIKRSVNWKLRELLDVCDIDTHSIENFDSLRLEQIEEALVRLMEGMILIR